MKVEAHRKLLTALVIISVALVAAVLVFNVQSPPRVEVTFVGYTNQVPTGVASGAPQPHALFKVENKSDRLLGVVTTQLEVRTKQGWQDLGAPVVRSSMGFASFPTSPASLSWPEPNTAEVWRLRLTFQSLCGIGHSAFRTKLAELLRNQGKTSLADQVYYPIWSLRTPEVAHSAFANKTSP